MKTYFFKTRIYNAEHTDFSVWQPGPTIAANSIEQALLLTEKLFITVDQEAQVECHESIEARSGWSPEGGKSREA